MPLMKFYTLADWKRSGNCSLQEFDEFILRDKQYRAYLESIRSRLPARFQHFLDLASLCDGEVLEISIEPSSAVASLRCTALDNASNGRNGHYLRLNYHGVQNFQSIGPEEESFGGDGYGDIGNDEIELLAEGVFQHRLLFSTGIEIAVTFRDFTFDELPWSQLRETAYGKRRRLLERNS
jgi:hypothetical protein